MTVQSTALESPQRLGDFLRTRQDEIIADWKERVRALSPARDLSDAAIVDHLPHILGRISEIVRTIHTGGSASLGQLAKDHVIDRLARGFDLDQVVTEYSLLRRSIVALWRSQVGRTIDIEELEHLDLAFDESIRQSVLRHAQAREKLLKAVDRISEAALGSTDVRVFLHNLLAATLDAAESVDTAAVLLREGDALRVRAAVGLEQDLDATFSMTRREGLPGHVAAEGQPIFIRDAATDPRIVSRAIRGAGVRALYGVPMVREGKVIGVAHIGSLSAYDFSDEDKLLFRTMVSRATSVVVKTQLVADLRRAETSQRFLSDASKQLAESFDYQAALGSIASLAVPAIADWCAVDLVIHGKIERLAVAHADPAKERLAEELRERDSPDRNAATGVAHVVRTGKPEWLPEMGDRELAAAGRDSGHLRILRELGTRAYIIVPIASRGEVFGTIALATGESGRRYSEADLMLAEELARRAGTAIENARLYSDSQKAVQLRERILAIVSHDLRNQLGVVAGNASILSRKTAGDGADVAKPIETIQRTAARMQQLVGDLLDMASIQAGHLAFEMEPTDVEALLAESCHTHEELARGRRVHLRTDLHVDGARVLCDRGRVLQVLANLVGNAIKFSRAGDTVTLRADARERDVLVAVRDAGPGIPADQLESIFEPYRTGPDRDRSGTGLGLYIARGIVERHGGRIWVESRLGAGSTFCFTLQRGES